MKNKIIPEKTQDEIKNAESQIIELSKKIEFYITEYSVELLANKMKTGDFVVPNYQRMYTWEPERKSKFIESLIIGLPIPFLFFWEMPDGRLEIVDGSQRLRTIQEFVLDDYRLTELESLTKLSGFKFSDLETSRRRKINNRSIRGIVLNEHADEQARFDLFERINTGSKIANKAEVRRGVLSGDFMNLVIELAELPLFRKLAPVTKKARNERESEELVTRFFAYSDGLDGYKDRPSEFLFNYTRRMNEVFHNHPELIEEYREIFVNTMNFIDAVFPNGFRKTATATVTPRARFEAIAIGSRLALVENPLLNAANIPNVGEWLNGVEFQEVTGSDGANVKSKLNRRLQYAKNNLLGNNQ